MLDSCHTPFASGNAGNKAPKELLMQDLPNAGRACPAFIVLICAVRASLFQ